MKIVLYFLFLSLILNANAQAPIKLIGVTNNTGTGHIDLLKWTAFDSSSVTATPTILDAYFFATSAFDPFSSNYYLTGVSGQTTGLFSYNSESNASTLTAGVSHSNLVEFDMSNSKMYNLTMEMEGYINIYEYDINSNHDSLIGTIYEPGVTAIVADAISFDSNNGILYYVGYTNEPALALYAISVRNSSFSYSKTILNTINVNSNITSVNFDNVNEKLFATNDTFDQNGNSTGRSIIEIDINTGEVNTLVQLSDFANFLAGSSLFDQNSGTFLLVGITNSNMLKMIAFDTYSNTYVTGFVPDNVSEIACDNSSFARSRYSVSSIDSQAALNFKMYPNPVSNILNLEGTSNGAVQIQIFSADGKLVYEIDKTSFNKMDLELPALTSGLYTVRLSDSKQTLAKKIFVK